MSFFEDASHVGISAVIYCTDSILKSLQLPQEMGENFIIVHNPLARSSLPAGVFPFGDEYIVEEGYIKNIRKRVESGSSASIQGSQFLQPFDSH